MGRHRRAKVVATIGPASDSPAILKTLFLSGVDTFRLRRIATQMLNSMVSSPTPTRAEASDVATAIYDGADTVMLSAKSATSDYSNETVQMMDSIISATEGHTLLRLHRACVASGACTAFVRPRPLATTS